MHQLCFSLLCAPLFACRLLAADAAAGFPTADSTSPPAAAASNAAQVSPDGTTAPASSAADLQKLREQIAKQQEEIKRLQQSLEEQQKAVDSALGNVATPAPVATVNTSNPGAPVSLVPAVNRPNDNAVQHGETQPSPLGVRIGTTTFTPLGFIDATYFSRSTNVGSGIGTNFLGIPYNNAVAGRLSETNFSLQNSRLGMRIDSNVLGANVLGYWESDFLFNNNAAGQQITSNSVGFRLRNFFVDVQKNGFEVLGGQDWSLLTPNRNGLSPLPSDIFYTQNMDTNYQLGLVWSRAPQFRFIAHPSDNVAFGVALENPQQYIGGGSGAATVALPSNLNATLANQFNSGQSAMGIPNWFPDIIAKAAFDGHLHGLTEHVEVAGLVSGFKEYIPPSVTTAISGTHTAVGFGGEVNFNLELFKNFRIVSNNFFSDGGGRYIFGAAPDVVIRPNGAISPVRSDSTLDGFEAQITPKMLLAAYYGGVYIGKNVSYDPFAAGSTLAKPVYVGYGYPGSTSYRDGQEITFDWVQTLWKNPNYGALSLINQYSYLMKEPWVTASAGPKQAHTNLVYINLRYTLP
jgi:hypothetical protein